MTLAKTGGRKGGGKAAHRTPSSFSLSIQPDGSCFLFAGSQFFASAIFPSIDASLTASFPALPGVFAEISITIGDRTQPHAHGQISQPAIFPAPIDPLLLRR